ncbi:MAG: hypothetical protein AAGG51_23095 [Cyanobacteria bacterium P01_G01_bin.54]
MAEQYLIQVVGLGYIHKNWKDAEPQFAESRAKAKSWKTREGAVGFGAQKLTPRLRTGWELWQEIEGELIPIMKPRRDMPRVKKN